MPSSTRVSVSFTTPDGWPPEWRARLQAVASGAIARALLAVHVSSVAEPSDAPPRHLDNERERRERIDAARVLRGGGGYLVPSHQRGGEPVALPAQLTFDEPAQVVGGLSPTTIVTGVEDVVFRREMPYETVLHATGNVYLFAGGSPFVASQSLARAIEWGQYLFGSRGYAIWQREAPSGATAFWTAGVRASKPLHELGLTGRRSAPGDRIGDIEIRAVREAQTLYSKGIVAVVLPEGIALVDASGPWAGGALEAGRKAVPKEEAFVEPGEARYVGWKLLQTARDEQVALQLIVRMDHTMFALVPWEERATYLQLLVRADLDRPRRVAVIELLRGTRTEPELEAMFSVIRRNAAYDELFNQLDDRLFELLETLGEFRSGAKLDWRYIVDLVYELDFAGGAPTRELWRAWGGLRNWVLGLLEGLAFIFTKPGEVVAGLAHLGELIGLVERARFGNREAQAQLVQLVSNAAESIAKAIRGLRYADQLGRPHGERERGAKTAGDILGRLKYALVLEILSWFVGIGEVKAALSAARVPEALGRVLSVLMRLGRLGKGAELARSAARLERILLALGRLAKVGEDEARVARLLEFLPEEQIGQLGRLAEAIDVPRGAGASEALLHAGAGDQELQRAVKELRQGLAAAGRIEAKAGQAGVTAEMAAGLRRLLRDASWPEETLLKLLDDVPPAILADFMHMLAFVKPEHFGVLGADAFIALAHRPQAMALLRDGGSELFAATFKRTGGSWEEIDRLAAGVAARKAELRDPVDYQRYLDRLIRGEAAAVEQTEAAAALARLRRAGHERLLHELDQVESAAVRNRWAAQMGKLGDRELEGLEAVAASGADWIDIALGLDRANRQRFLLLVADVARHPRGVPVHGIEEALRAFFEGGRFDIQGAMGEIEAARTAIDRFGATEIWFQHRWAEGGLRRHTDVVAMLPGRGMTHVEVKAYLSGRASLQSFAWEVERDLVLHAQNEYRELLYLLHPNTRPQLARLGEDMADLFKTQRVRDLFAARGLDIHKAEGAFRRWLAAGNLTTY
jgi:hypothetical protein